MQFFLKTLFTISLCLFIAVTASAQLKIGGGLAYGTEINNVGITAKGHYGFTEVWEGAGSFTYFFTGEDAPGIDLRLWTLNADAHYLLNSTDKFNFYVLGGLNIAGVTVDINTGLSGFDGKSTNTEVGLNAGAGIVLGLTSSISGVAELKYVIGQFDQLVANIGILYNL